MDIFIRMFSLHQLIYWLLIVSFDDFNSKRPHFSILIKLYSKYFTDVLWKLSTNVLSRWDVVRVTPCQLFFRKLRHKAKLRSQPASFPIFSGKILKMQEKGPAATNWLKMRVIPQRGVGGINQARKTNAHLQSMGGSKKLLRFGQMLIAGSKTISAMPKG